MSNNYVVIMAGGIGSRFWPSSRSSKPKQFLDILGLGKSLIRLTFERFQHLVPDSNILVVTHQDYFETVKVELPELKDEQILCEPSRQNTAPCIAYAAFKIKNLNPNANFVVAPSDHLIVKEIEFLKKIEQGLDYVANNDALLTLGIKATHPNTGYGYIHYDKSSGDEDIFKVFRFTEKPDLRTAEIFLAGGEHLWNAGIFLWNVNTILKAYQEYQPELYSAFENIADKLSGVEEKQIIEQLYPSLASISVDYAIMENAPNIYTLPADIGWSDIGTWGALHEIAEKDPHENSILAANKGQIILEHSENCLVKSSNPDKLIVIGDLDDYIVVDEKDVLLIYPKDKEQEIKPLLKNVEEKFGGRFS
jgi:mannose-1-phosphate guanylyltransferase